LSAVAWVGKQDMDGLVEKYGMTYPTYHRIKVDSVIDATADIVCSVGSVGRPELAQVIREVTVRWVRRAYPDFRDELKLLLDADVDYRLRKLSFILRGASAGLSGKALEEVRKTLKEGYDALYLLRKQMRKDFDAIVRALRATVLSDEELSAVAATSGTSRKERIEKLVNELEKRGEVQLKGYFDNSLGPGIRGISDRVAAALRGTPLERPYEAFENYDMVLYPIIRHGAVDEAVLVEVVRISPDEARPPRPVPLAGTSLGHFGAFLEGDWRRNDIVCGRLDAAEVIIRQLVKDETRARPVVEEAHREIVAEALASDLQQRIVTGRLPKAVKQQALEVLADKAQLLDLFKRGKAYDLAFDGATQVRSAGRAGVVAERIVRSWALKARFPFPAVIRWGVLLVAMLGQIAIPRSLTGIVASYWARLLALVFLVIAAGGFIANQKELTGMGLKGAAVLGLLTATALVIASLIGERLARQVLRGVHWVAALAVGYAVVRAVHLPSDQLVSLAGRWWTSLDALSVKMILIVLALGMLLSVVADIVSMVRAVGRRVPFFRMR
jgi:uncharacterized protein DUF3376